MKKLLVVNICVIILFAGSLGIMFVKTDVYDDVERGIVEVLCLSCIKLQPKTSHDFTFKTVKNQPHPDFIIDSLKTNGPLLIQYGEDGCDSCITMIEEVMKPYFNLEYPSNYPKSFETQVNVENLSFYYIYIYLDDPGISEVRADSYKIYDKDQIGGFPQFTIITLNYDHSGEIKPYYTTLYGEFEGSNPKGWEKAKTVFKEILEESRELYEENLPGFK